MAKILFAGEPGFFPTAFLDALARKGHACDCVHSLRAAEDRLTLALSTTGAYAAFVTARYVFLDDGSRMLCADGGFELVKAHGHLMPCVMVTNAKPNGAMDALDAHTKVNLHVHPCAAMHDDTLLNLLHSFAPSDNGNGG